MSPSVEPFDEAKYKALMDGLECSEIMFSQIDLGDRFDSDYYTKNYLQLSLLVRYFASSSNNIKKLLFSTIFVE